MAAVDELLNDSGISACLSTHQGSVTQVRRAAEFLAEKRRCFDCIEPASAAAAEK